MLSWGVLSRVEKLKALSYAIDSYGKTLALVNSLPKQNVQLENEAMYLASMAEEFGLDETEEDEY